MSKWLEEAIKTMPSQNAGGAPTATPDQLLEFHTVTRYVAHNFSYEYIHMCILIDSYLSIVFSAFRSETPKTVTHALRNFARLYR